MKKISKFFFVGLLFLFVGLSSCMDDNDDYLGDAELERLEGYMAKYYPDAVMYEAGFYIVDKVEGNGEPVVDGEYAVLNYSVRTLFSSCFETNVDSVARANNIYDEKYFYNPSIVKVSADTILDGLHLALQELKVGDKARIIFPSSLGYGSENTTTVNAYSTLVYDVEIIDVAANYKTYEMALINEYLTANNIEAVYDEEFEYYYQILNEGDSLPIVEDAEVSANYYGHSFYGKYFDTNIESVAYENGIWSAENYTNEKYKPIQFRQGNRDVIAGWEYIAAKLQKGSEVMVFLPSDLCYGEKGNESYIRAYTPLVFYIEITDVDLSPVETEEEE